MSSEEELFFFGGTEWSDDDDRIDYYPLFVLEDIAVAETENFLRRNIEDCGDEMFWLADDYNSVPDLSDIEFYTHRTQVTALPLEPGWKSPFQGKTAQDAANYLRSVPKPRKPLCKTYFVILDMTRYREHDQVLICKILEDGQVQSIPCDAAQAAVCLYGHDRYTWEDDYVAWEEKGFVLMAA